MYFLGSSTSIEKFEHAANARLIAASPEMLKALQRVASLNPDAGEIGAGMLKTIVHEARSAIAKATIPPTSP